jgi:hypothetical protein
MQWHPYGNTDPFKIPEFADKLLNEYLDITEDLGIQTFLIDGVVLGLVRDGTPFIEGDNDIDVGIFGDFEKFRVELVKNGFICKRIWKINAHFLKYNILFDVFFDFHDQKFLRSFDKVKYKGRDYNVPHPVENYLKERYGDWKTIKHRKVWEG